MCMMTTEHYRQFLRINDLTQAEFALLLGHSARTGQYWATQAVPGSVETWVRYIEARPEALQALRDVAAERDVDGKAVR